MPVFAATVDHLEPLHQLFDRYRQFYGKPSDLALAERFVKERLVNGDTRFIMATVEDDSNGQQAAGFVHLFSSFSSVSASRILILNDLYVQPNVRQKGVGRALMRAARDFARSSGYSGIKLETQMTNAIGQALYESEGYKRLNGFYQYFLNTPPSESWLKA